MSQNRKISFELSPGMDELDVHMNREGLLFLVAQLEQLLRNPETLPHHNHLMTPSWSGTELSEEKQRADSILLNKVTLRLWG